MPGDAADGAPVGRRQGLGERVLWGSRLLMFVGVAGSMLMVVVLILVIEFFQRSLRADLAEADDLLRLAAAISLVAVALTVPSLVGKRAGAAGSPASAGAEHVA